MNCIDQGKLMNYIDGELTATDAQLVAEHLELCPDCKEKYLRLLAAHRITQTALETYARNLNAVRLDTKKSWDNFKIALTRDKVRPREEKALMRLFGKRRYLAAGAAAAVLIALFSFVPGTSTLAAEFLNIFRVDRVQLVDFDRNSLEELQQELEKQPAVNMEQFADITHQPADAPQIIAPRIADSKAGFDVLLPDTLAEAVLGEVTLQPGSKAVIKPKVKAINNYLQNSGSEKLLPAQLDGKEITISIANSVAASYGGIQLVQSASPEITVPEGVDFEEIRGILLLSPLLPDEIRLALSSVKDWQRTMVIPNIEGTSKEVEVNGIQGVFVTLPQHPGQDYNHPSAALIWPRGEVWMTISGNLTLEESLKLAAALR